jgi:hypothetical protein
MTKRLIFLIIIYSALQILDFYTTWYGLKLGLGEKNPFVKLLSRLGEGTALAVVKGISVALTFALLYVALQLAYSMDDLNALVAGLDLLYLTFVVRNTLLIMGYEKRIRKLPF